MSPNFSRRSFIGSGAAASAALATACFNGENGAPPQVATLAPTPPPSWFQVFGTEPGLARLNRNENPFGPSPRVQQAIRDVAGYASRYASTDYLEAMIGERHGLADAQILMANGSIDNLTAASLAWGARGTILCADLFWDQTARQAEANGAKIRRVPLDPDLRVNLSKLEAAMDDSVSLVHLCNPNNPTGLLLDPDELRAFCERVSRRATVLIDEAYIELTSEPERNSMLGLARAGHNVLVSRTFSKIYGMAGMRVGYMVGTPENLERVDRLKAVCWVAAPSVAAAIAAFDDDAFLIQSKARVIEAREMVIAAVERAGLSFVPSQANFLFVNVQQDAEAFRTKMQQRGVLIQGIYRDYTTWSRVSMGDLPDVERYVKALPEALAV